MAQEGSLSNAPRQRTALFRAFRMAASADHVLDLGWRHGEAVARLEVDLARFEGIIEITRNGKTARMPLGDAAPDSPERQTERSQAS